MSIRKFTLFLIVVLLAALFVSDRRPVDSQKATVTVEGPVRTVGDLAIQGVWVSLILRGQDGLSDPDLVATLGNLASVIRVRSDLGGRFRVDVPTGNMISERMRRGFSRLQTRMFWCLSGGKRPRKFL
jgi:hypothetical protein